MDTSTRALAAATLALVFAACAPSLSEDGRRCPCAAGWVCCTGNDVCVRGGGQCPAPLPSVPAPNLAASFPPSPTRLPQVDISGKAPSRTRVDIFTNPRCAEPLAASGTADAAGAFLITVDLALDTTNRFWARAVDGAGNPSTCTAHAFEVVHDGTPPAVPTFTGVSPAAISNATLYPQIAGSGDPASIVRLYAGSNCAQELPFSAQVDTTGTFRITALVAPNSVTVFHARAGDGAGNVSACSQSAIQYEHDDVPPEPPFVISTSPASPSQDPAPVIVVAAEPFSTVQLFAGPDCPGDPLGQQPADAAGIAQLKVALAHNANTPLSARAVDVARNRSACGPATSYVHDDMPPSPIIYGSAIFAPQSPSRSTEATVSGFAPAAEPGETVRVRGYVDGAVAWETSAVVRTFFFEAPFTVASNGTTDVYVTTIDAIGNAGAETYAGSFVNDTIPPPWPSVIVTSELSPSRTDTAFMVAGVTAPGTSIDVWSDSDCTEQLPGALSGIHTDEGTYSAWAGVAPEGTTEVYATATDPAGNRSPCSATHATYVRDTDGPGWGPTMTAPANLTHEIVLTPVGTAFGLIEVNGAGGAGNDIEITTAAPGGTWSPLETVATFTGGDSISPVRLNTEGENLLVFWGDSTMTSGEIHARVRGQDGTWRDETTVATHALPRSWVGDAIVVPDRNGGSWAMWLALDIRTNSPGGQELWLAHHGPSGWSTPTLVAARWRFDAFRIASAKTGDAVLAWADASGIDGGRSAWISFYAPASGWSAPEELDGAAAYMPLEMDDEGNTLLTRWTTSDPAAFGTRIHRPGSGWEPPVTEHFEAGRLSGGLTRNAKGDVVAYWTLENGAQFFKRYSAVTGWLAAERAPMTGGEPGFVSYGVDGSIWTLAVHTEPGIGFNGIPTWMWQCDSASGWHAPQIAVDDADACTITSCRESLTSLIRDDAGHALLHWTNNLTGPLNRFRWFY
jgi:hypothetical protein